MADRPELYNSLVRARFELTTFVERLDETDREALETECAPHLRAAIFAVAVERGDLSEDVIEILDYVADRLNYVHDRMVLLY